MVWMCGVKEDNHCIKTEKTISTEVDWNKSKQASELRTKQDNFKQSILTD